MNGHNAFFLHIPRTAGTTFTRILAKRYGNPTIVATSKEFTALAADRDRAPKLITGHFYAYQLPEWSQRDTTIFTIVRDPLDRLISSYRFCRRLAAAGQELPAHMKYASDVDFLEYAFSIHGNTDRHMALYLLGLDAGDSASTTPLRTLLARAKARLRGYRCVLTGQVDDIASGAGQRPQHLNTTDAEGFEDAIRESKLLAEALKYDYELYEYAAELARIQGNSDLPAG